MKTFFSVNDRLKLGAFTPDGQRIVLNFLSDRTTQAYPLVERPRPSYITFPLGESSLWEITSL